MSYQQNKPSQVQRFNYLVSENITNGETSTALMEGVAGFDTASSRVCDVHLAGLNLFVNLQFNWAFSSHNFYLFFIKER